MENRHELNELISEKAELKSSHELLGMFETLGVPAGLMKNMEEVFEDDQAKALLLKDQMDNGSTAIRTSQIAFKIS